MRRKTPLGIIIVSSIMTFIGGLSSFILLIEIIDSLRIFGFHSILINSYSSFSGFIIYAALPITLYITGIGLFMSRPWARWSAITIIPAFLFIFFVQLMCNMIKRQSPFIELNTIEVFLSHFDIFVNVFFRYVLVVSPLFFYLLHPNIKDYFHKIKLIEETLKK